MITKKMVVDSIVGDNSSPIKMTTQQFAPANIALIKYWGKRDQELNLPVTSSLSLSLEEGTHTTVTVAKEDSVLLNGAPADEAFTKRLFAFCDLFRTPGTHFHIDTKNTIPTAAGFASSSSGFAALTLCLNDLFGWNKDAKILSILARMGSGSACRSLYKGFVLWNRGSIADGSDSFAEPISTFWPELKLDLVMISSKKKPIDSRRAMQITVDSSPLYSSWPAQVERDLPLMQQAIREKNVHLLGQVAEQNALAMHATMIAASPSICYWQPETVEWMHKIWQLRKEGPPIYFTMDAGPNLKLLSLAKDAPAIHQLLWRSHAS